MLNFKYCKINIQNILTLFALFMVVDLNLIPLMKRNNKIFWILYFIWAIVNIAFLVLAVYDIFGEFDKSSEKFWPFTVGGLKTYDFLELLIYLAIPLVFFYSYRFTHHSHVEKAVEEIQPMIKEPEFDETI